MKKKIAKLLALGMSIALVFSLAACGGTDDVPSTEPDTTPAAFVPAEPASGDAATPSDDASAADPSETAGAPNSNEGQGSGSNEQKPADTGIKTPTSVAEVVSLYNSAVAKAGFTTATLQPKWERSLALGQDLNDMTGGKVKPEFEKTLTKSVKPGSISESDIKTAGAKAVGNTITLTIGLKDFSNLVGTDVNYGEHSYPYFINLADAKELIQRCSKAAGASISISDNSARFDISNGSITAEVDKTTGKMTSLHFTFSQHVSGKAMGMVQADIWGNGIVDFS